MWAVARRPRWVWALVFALVLAGGFAALGQWQLERGIASARVVERDTETLRLLTSVTGPQQPVANAAEGQRVGVTGTFQPGSWVVLSGRSDGRGDTAGAWVVGRLITDVRGGRASVAVALGWAKSVSAASAVAATLDDTLGGRSSTVTGRYLAGEAPQGDDFENGVRSSLSLPALVNVWPGESTDVFGGYIVADAAPAGLGQIVAPAPSGDVQLNWLNIFYAIEWVVFAGFAVYMWFRLVKDAWERETDPGEDLDDFAGDVPSDDEGFLAGSTPSGRVEPR